MKIYCTQKNEHLMCFKISTYINFTVNKVNFESLKRYTKRLLPSEICTIFFFIVIYVIKWFNLSILNKYKIKYFLINIYFK